MTMPPEPVRWLDAAFAGQAAACPGAVALVDGDRLVTYAELDRAGGDVAAALARHGVAPGGLVRLRLDRGWRVVAGILGCWRHGCGFVPIDPRYPRARQDYIVADTGLRHVLTEDADPDRLAVVAPAAPGGAIPRVPADTAYVIHTSGSTGDPKGVVVRHANVLSLLDACAEVYSLGPDDVWSWFHSHSFDFSVWEIWGALLSGGRVVTVPPATTTDPAALADLLAARRVSVLSQVPSVFGYLVRALQERPVPLPRLRYVVFGGEAIAVPAILRWAALGVAPQAELYNMYGITEITVHATAKLLDVAELRRPARGTPIGVALPNLRLVLLADGRPVAPGTPGEVHVAGEGVAWGYLGRPELTAERFPRLDVDGRAEVWYRTGDYAVARPDGELEFLGRRDDQVQLRGFRVELGEIEVALGRRPGVRECAVVLAEDGRGERFLVACYVPADPAGGDLGPALRDAFAARLPRHMVPARYVAVPRLPQTLSAKLDRAALARLVASDGG